MILPPLCRMVVHCAVRCRATQLYILCLSQLLAHCDTKNRPRRKLMQQGRLETVVPPSLREQCTLRPSLTRW